MFFSILAYSDVNDINVWKLKYYNNTWNENLGKVEEQNISSQLKIFRQTPLQNLLVNVVSTPETEWWSATSTGMLHFNTMFHIVV